MAGLERIKPVRAFGLGLAAALLAACAGMPAPVSVLGEHSAQQTASAPPYDPSTPPRVVDHRAHLQCVPFAREESGIQIYGDANTWWSQAAGRYPRSSSPAVGSVMVMRAYSDPGHGHVAVVTQLVSSRVILVNHANWLNHGEISVNVPVADVSPNNDWSEVRVWYIPNRGWGARTYQAHGFIHPFLMSAAIS
jgi:surface antigen